MPNRMLLWLGISAVCFAADQTVRYQEDMERFANPERGFCVPVVLNAIPSLRELEDLRYAYITLVYAAIDAKTFLDDDLSKEFIRRVEWGFYRLRQAGLKAIVCVTYGDKPDGPDASMETILRHIDQFGPILKENSDVIYLFEAGFIGPQGRWRNWQDQDKDTRQNRHLMITRLLEVFPRDRMVVLPGAEYKMDLYDGKVLASEQAFSDNPLARIGYCSHAFLSGPDDGEFYTDKKPRWAWIDRIGSETRFVPFGGAVTKMSSFCRPSEALDDMQRLHCSWLNETTGPEVVASWKKAGIQDEIERRLGYRFVLDSVAVTSGKTTLPRLNIRIQLHNTGFASPFNARPVELLLRTGDKLLARVLDEDVRLWLPGKPIVIEATLDIPNEFLGQTCRLELFFPDASRELRTDPRYSIRLASMQNTRIVWDTACGSNILIQSLNLPKPQTKTNHTGDPK